MDTGKSTAGYGIADGHFPVQIRMSLPDGGLGQKLNEMHRWVHDRVGLNGFSQSRQRNTAAHDDVLFYFDDLAVAREFVEHFDCARLITLDGPPAP